jgi:poly-gamma-glutamate capsule biosynthesis protein CapA/YwtB (metallophosphatase superfamily)
MILKTHPKRYIFVILSFLAVVINLSFFLPNKVVSNQNSAIIKQGYPEDQSDTLRFTISSVGDIMVHQTQLTAQKNSDGSYSFVNNFVSMKPLLSFADISIGNLETTFAGEKKGYSAYPMFNSPDALSDAIKFSGINLVVTTNNHTFDHGGSALIRTIEVLEKTGLEYVGTRKSTNDKNYVVRNVNGIKVGVTAYTYESGKKNGLKTINGLLVSKEFEGLINSYNPYKPENDIKEMQEVVNSMKNDSAEFIVFVMHWGDEYKKYPNNSQQFMAEQLNLLGVDLIFGSHPHVVQPVDFILNDSTGQLTFVAYSMGNFISNQRFETMQNYATEDGLFIGAEVVKVSGQKPFIQKIFYEPTWVNRYLSNGRYYYEVIPTNVYLKQREAYNLSAEEWSRIEGSNKRTTELIESPFKESKSAFYERFLKRYTPDNH